MTCSSKSSKILLLLVASGAKPGCLVREYYEPDAIGLELKVSKSNLGRTIFVYNEAASDSKVVELKLRLDRGDRELKRQISIHEVNGQAMGYLSPFTKGANSSTADRVIDWMVNDKEIFCEVIQPNIDEKMIQAKQEAMASKMAAYPKTAKMKLTYTVRKKRTLTIERKGTFAKIVRAPSMEEIIRYESMRTFIQRHLPISGRFATKIASFLINDPAPNRRNQSKWGSLAIQLKFSGYEILSKKPDKDISNKLMYVALVKFSDPMYENKWIPLFFTSHQQATRAVNHIKEKHPSVPKMYWKASYIPATPEQGPINKWVPALL